MQNPIRIFHADVEKMEDGTFETTVKFNKLNVTELARLFEFLRDLCGDNDCVDLPVLEELTDIQMWGTPKEIRNKINGT